ncbi:MAG TPA: hypothetical protein VJX67_25445, partial [Blastocatellia bacterium]|nr:hypothetical protein [Blastocatellia bacterium]
MTETRDGTSLSSRNVTRHVAHVKLIRREEDEAGRKYLGAISTESCLNAIMKSLRRWSITSERC